MSSKITSGGLGWWTFTNPSGDGPTAGSRTRGNVVSRAVLPDAPPVLSGAILPTPMTPVTPGTMTVVVGDGLSAIRTTVAILTSRSRPRRATLALGTVVSVVVNLHLSTPAPRTRWSRGKTFIITKHPQFVGEILQIRCEHPVFVRVPVTG